MASETDLSPPVAKNVEVTDQFAPIPRALLLAMAVSTIGFIILSMHLPIDILADAGYDDALFVAHAGNIVAGHWLGLYGQTTLAKGPGYPIFLALNAILGIPVTLTQALLYSGSCILLAITLFRIFGSAWVCLLSFLLMQWHPAMFPVRAVRDDLSASQVLLILSCVCHFVFLPTRLRNRLLWAAAGGLVLGWFWITREDAIWILPGLAVISGLQAIRLLPVWQKLGRLAISMASFSLGAIVICGVVAAINLMTYGAFIITDVKTPSFASALDILQTVRVGEPVPYVPVPGKVRQQLDTVSPAFASLDLYLNGQGRKWMKYGCPDLQPSCTDFAGGWFIWALRDAVNSQGYYRTPSTAAVFYQKLWTEVNAACKAKRIECRKNILPFMPAMRSDQWDRLPAKLRQIYGLATWQDGQPNGYVLTTSLVGSTGEDAQIQRMDSFLGNPVAASRTGQDMPLTVAGWFLGPKNLWLQLRCTSAEGDTLMPVLRQPSPDLVAVFHNPDFAKQRFEMTLPPIRNCGFEPYPIASQGGHFNIGTAVVGSSRFAGGTLALDILSRATPGNQGIRALGLLQRISRFYGHIIPVATLLALLVYTVSLLCALLRNRKRLFDAQLIILTGIGTLLLGRAGILALVDISSFPAILPSYWGAGYPLLSLAIVLSLARFSLKGKA